MLALIDGEPAPQVGTALRDASINVILIQTSTSTSSSSSTSVSGGGNDGDNGGGAGSGGAGSGGADSGSSSSGGGGASGGGASGGVVVGANTPPPPHLRAIAAQLRRYPGDAVIATPPPRPHAFPHGAWDRGNGMGAAGGDVVVQQLVRGLALAQFPAMLEEGRRYLSSSPQVGGAVGGSVHDDVSAVVRFRHVCRHCASVRHVSFRAFTING
jgi:hypothetical protein